MWVGLVGAAGPYSGLTAHLDGDPHIITATRIAMRLPGVNPMDVLRSDEMEWQFWLAMARCVDMDRAEAGD